MTIRSIPDITVTDPTIRDTLEAMKEVIEVMLGRRGSDANDQVLTKGDSSTIVGLFEALNTGLSHDTLADVSANDHHAQAHDNDDHTEDYIPESLLDAQSIVAAVADDTPVAVTVAASRIVGRAAAGNIDDLTAAQVKTILDIQDTDVEIYSRTETVRDALDAGLRDGIMSGLVVSDLGGLNISWTAGVVFVDGSLFDVNLAGSTGLTDNSTNYLYALKDNATLQISTTEPDVDVVGEFALRGKYSTSGGDIHYACTFPDMAGSLRYKIWQFLKSVMPTMVVSGCKCEVNTGGLANDFKIGTGSYFVTALCEHTISSILYSAGVGLGETNVEAHYHVASSWSLGSENGISFDYWDNGTQKTADSIGKWYCGFVFMEGGDTPLYVYPQTEHAHEGDATAEALVYPPHHEKYALPVARFIFRGGASAFGSTAYFVDIRPFLNAGSNGGGHVQNIFQTITGDSGSTTADESDDSIAITGTAPIETTASEDALDIAIPAATNAQDGYATAAHITAIEANTADQHTQGTDTALGAVGTKNPPIDADKAVYRDSTDSDALVTSTWTQIKAFLKTYFDTLYNNYAHPNHSGDVTSAADGATTIAAKAVDVAMLADGTDGQLITWDAAGEAATVATGTADQVLTSNGAGAAPTFQDSAGGDHAASHTDGSDDIQSATNAQKGVATAAQITALEANTAARHAESHTVASHSDTTVTGAELDTLTDNSIADTLHRHSELVASDGTPDPALSVDADGKVSLVNGTGINEFSIDGTLAGNSDDAVPTEKAVKTYADDNFAKNYSSAADVNTLVKSGMYRLATNTNLPTSVNYGQLLVIRGGGDTIIQIVGDYTSQDFYWRSGNSPEVGGSGSWAAWRKIWHAGNDGTGSGLDADKLEGQHASVTAGNDTIVQRNASGYVFANYFNTTPNDVSSGVTRVCVETGNDGYIRHGTAAAIRAFIGTDAPSYVKVSDVKASGTNGGTFTSAAWRTRVLNTKDSDTDGICTLSSNQITLAAGTYECRISAPATYVRRHQAKVRNTTVALDIMIGTTQIDYETVTTMGRSFIVGKFTVAAGQVLEIQHICELTSATYGFGTSCGFGVSEVYTIAEFWKVG